MEPRRRADYERVRSLPGGAFGDIWIARKVGPHGWWRPVVIKSARPGREDAERALIDEARAINLLNHPNVVDALDFYIEEIEGGERRHCLVLEYMECSLSQILRSQGRRLEPALVAYMGTQICAGLGHANENGIIHRDVKPGNVMINVRGDVKLIDFGIARWGNRLYATTQNTKIKGSLPYLSPEQCRSDELDGRSDQWSVGVVLYEMLAGRLPFRTVHTSQLDQFRDLSTQIQTKQPDPLPTHVPPQLGAVVLRCLEKKRENRFPDAAATITALEAAAVREWSGRQQLSNHARTFQHASIQRLNIGEKSQTIHLSVEASEESKQAPLRIEMDSMRLRAEQSDSSAIFTDEVEPRPTGVEEIITEVLPRIDIQAPLPRRSALRAVPAMLIVLGVMLLAGVLAWVESSADARNADAAKALAAGPHSAAAKAPEAHKPPAHGTVPNPMTTPQKIQPPTAEPSEPITEARKDAGATQVVTSASSKLAGQGRKRPPAPALASLSVVISPRNGFVSVDGGEVQRTPHEFTNLRVGRHTVRAGFERDRFTKEQIVKLTAGGNELLITLDDPFNPFASK